MPASLSFVKEMIPDLAKKYEVILLSSPGYDWHALDNVIEMVRGIEIPMARKISVKDDIKALFKVYKLFRKEKPDLVHSMTPKAGLICMVAAWLARVPIRIHMFTGLVFPTSTGLKRRILMATDWLTCACATHVIPEGEGVKKDLITNGITKKDIHVLGYGNCKGIDLDYFDPNLIYEIALYPPQNKLPKLFEVEQSSEFLKGQNLKPYKIPNTFTFIVIGRLAGDKGINELIAAYSKLRKEYSNIRLILLGHTESIGDPLKNETLQVIRKDASIEAVGIQYDIRPWISVSDAAILASYREGFPNAVIECGAMGLPQIVTDINGANEIIIESKNGTIVPPRDSEALYAAMKRMITDDEWRNSLARNAREMIASRYNRAFVQKCLYDFYDKVIEQQFGA